MVRPWTKKPYLYLLPYPLLPIRLVVVAVFQEREFQKVVVEVVVVVRLQIYAGHGRVVDEV